MKMRRAKRPSLSLDRLPVTCDSTGIEAMMELLDVLSQMHAMWLSMSRLTMGKTRGTRQ